MFVDQNVVDAQTLSLLGTETLRINTRVYEARYPSWDFSRLVSVNTSGGEWSGGEKGGQRLGLAIGPCHPQIM